jgi:hypothetical protein
MFFTIPVKARGANQQKIKKTQQIQQQYFEKRLQSEENIFISPFLE